MFELPLFPLETVLFPSMPIHLHIFEPRYREMINRCITLDQPFGVVLIRRGAEAGGEVAEPYAVGVAARISRVERLEDGRMNLTALGEERFRILGLSRSRAYLVGQVQSLPLEHPCSLDMQRGAKQLLPWMRHYLDLISRLDPENELDLRELQLPEDPLLLSYLSAMLLQLPPHEKQPLLEAPDAHTLLQAVLRLVRREATVMASTRGAEKAEWN